MRAIPAATKANIISLLKNEHSIREISKRTGVSNATVCRIRKKCTKELVHKLSPGRPRVLSLHQERNLVRMVSSGKWSNAEKANYFLKVDYGVDLTTKCIRNSLKRNGLHSYVKQKKPFLSKIHRMKRLKFARRYKTWTAEDWKKIIWTDESKFNVFGSKGRQYYWKRQDGKFRDSHVKATMKYGGGHIMVWGSMTSQGTCHKKN
jgi:transposase